MVAISRILLSFLIKYGIALVWMKQHVVVINASQVAKVIANDDSGHRLKNKTLLNLVMSRKTVAPGGSFSKTFKLLLS